MKKLLAVLICLALVIGLAACGGGNQPAPNSPNGNQPAPDTTGASQPDPNPESPPVIQGDNLASAYAKIIDEFDPSPVATDAFPISSVDRPLKIGMAGRNMGAGFFSALHTSVQAELQKYGVEVLMADAQDSVETQTNQIDNFIAQGVDGIVINIATPSGGVIPALARAYEAGIPVVFVDSLLDESDNFHDYLGFVGGDNFLLGRGIGVYMAEQMMERNGTYAGKVAILNGQPNPIADTRHAGFWDGYESVAGANSGLEEVAHLYGGAWTAEAGVEMGENVLAANPHLDLIVGIADPFVVGAWQAAERLGRTEMIMGAVDGSKDALRLVSEGTPIEVITCQNPVGMGQIGARMILDYIVNGNTPEYRSMKLDPPVATPSNIGELYDPNSGF